MTDSRTKIKRMITSFAVRMTERMLRKHSEGKRGWDKEDTTDTRLTILLLDAVDNEKWVDVGGYAGILDWRQQRR